MTADDVKLAHREGFVSVEHPKRYTTLGMATDQGKTSNVPGLAIMADALGQGIDEVGTTRFRPPFAPVSIGSLATDTKGGYEGALVVPQTAALGDYDVVARTPGDARCGRGRGP